MRQSQLFSKTRKDVSSEEQANNARLLLRAGFIDRTMAGVYTLLPLGLRVRANLEQIIREEMNALGAQEMEMPALQPKHVWETTGRWDSMDDLYRFTSFHTHMDLALGPTHEEIITPLAKQYIASYKDLPRAVYQIQDKYRDEERAKSGLLRGREFSMKDLYSFHASEEDLEEYYEQVKYAYHRVYERLGLAEVTYVTYAPGGTFSRFSHEFQVVNEVGEDTIYTCPHHNVAVNAEIIDVQPNCPHCGEAELTAQSAIEVGNIFKLKTKFSDDFDLTFTDTDGENHPVIMGCFGIGVTRLLGALVETFAQGEKMAWPEEVAPYQVHLIALSKDESAHSQAEELYTFLREQNVRVLFDDRDESPGKKFTDADLLGAPHRLIVSPKSLERGGFELDGELYSSREELTRALFE